MTSPPLRAAELEYIHLHAAQPAGVNPRPKDEGSQKIMELVSRSRMIW